MSAMMILQILLIFLFFLDLNDGRCITTRHVSGYGNRGGGFISNDRDVDHLYFNEERCGWEIAVPPGATISFQFIEINLEPPSGGECFDYVAIYDGADENAPLLAKQCRRSATRRTYQTTQQFGFVYFFSDSSRRGEGFRLRWSRQAPKPSPDVLLNRQRTAIAPCTDTRFVSGLGIDQNGGYITNDKDSESLYFNGETCAWLISVPANSTIRFYFTKLDLETNDDCRFDWVAIYDGLRTTSPLLTKQCSPVGIGRNFYATQQYAFVQFHTDDSVQYEGFELRWLRQGPKSLPSLMRPTTRNYSAHCSETRLVSDRGDHGGFIVNDAGPDGLYLNGEHCTWQIHVANPLTIWLYFSEIELETSDTGECHDWVAIYDGPSRNSTLITKQCSTNALGANFHTTQSFAFIYFHTDNSQRFKGFKLHWLPQDNAPKSRSESGSTLAPSLTTTPISLCNTVTEIRAELDNVTDGFIESPNDPSTGLYGNNLRCSWRVVAPVGLTIKFWFTRIDMEHHESCWHDWVSIYDGESNHSRILTKQCSIRGVGRYFTTTQRNAFIHFRTDSSGRRGGFKLRWTLNNGGDAKTVVSPTISSSSVVIVTEETLENLTTVTTFLPLNENITEPIKTDNFTETTSLNETSLIFAEVNSLTALVANPTIFIGLVVIGVVGALVIFATVAFIMHCRRDKNRAVFYLKNIDGDSTLSRHNEQVYANLDAHVIHPSVTATTTTVPISTSCDDDNHIITAGSETMESSPVSPKSMGSEESSGVDA